MGYIIVGSQVHLFKKPCRIIGDESKKAGRGERIKLYSSQADVVFFGMAFGALPTSDTNQAYARERYARASCLEEEQRGRGDICSVIHHKLAIKFNRYFYLTAEAAEAAFQSTHTYTSLKQMQLPPPSIDDLLDGLNSAKTPEEKERIIEKLRRK